MKALKSNYRNFSLESTHEAENGSYIVKLSNCFLYTCMMTVYYMQSVFFLNTENN